MSEAPERIYLRLSKKNWEGVRRWQDLWRSDFGEAEYVRADIVATLTERAEAAGRKVEAHEAYGWLIIKGRPWQAAYRIAIAPGMLCANDTRDLLQAHVEIRAAREAADDGERRG